MLLCLQGFKAKRGRSLKITPKRPTCSCAELPLLPKFGSSVSMLVVSKVGQRMDKRGAQCWGVPLRWRGSAGGDFGTCWILGPVGCSWLCAECWDEKPPLQTPICSSLLAQPPALPLPHGGFPGRMRMWVRVSLVTSRRTDSTPYFSDMGAERGLPTGSSLHPSNPTMSTSWETCRKQAVRESCPIPERGLKSSSSSGSC